VAPGCLLLPFFSSLFPLTLFPFFPVIGLFQTKLTTTASQPAMTNDHHAYLKWPRLIAFNVNGALAITATALSARCELHLFASKEDSISYYDFASDFLALVNLNHDRHTLVGDATFIRMLMGKC
jgi:hypothetical protein